jgi:hypothetical protein
MDLNRYESPKGIEAKAKVDAGFSPNWRLVCASLVIILGPIWHIYTVVMEYPFVGGSHVPPVVRWGVIVTLYPVLILFGCYRLWGAFRRRST